METTISGPVTMRQAGVWLLPGEAVLADAELMGDVSKGLEYQRGRLFLTNRRVLRLLVSPHEAVVTSAALRDVHAVEVRRRERNPLWLAVGVLFVMGGITLGVASLTLLPSVLSPLLMALSISLIGVVFILSYVGGDNAEVVFTAGGKGIKCRVDARSVGDVGPLVERFYELKLGAERPEASHSTRAKA